MGMLLNNICYYFNLNDYISYTFDLLVGNSIIVIILLYVASYTFYFCKWHRLIISANLTNVIIANIDIYFRIPITDLHLARYIKDTIDDVDASSETTFRRWMATMIGNGMPIDWYEIV